ncbi:MAG: DegT/DnrJ/EryC1/StrS family aminotransferase [Alphaproteobacteria bacterium]
MLTPATLAPEDWNAIRAIVPDPEPALGRCPAGPRRGGAYPVAETRLVGNERRYLAECVDTNWISSRGPFVTRFERAFAPEAGCEYAVACANGTVALHLALAALGLGPGDEVIVPAFTMIATANAVRYTGAEPVLVDAEPVHGNIDPDRVEAAITPRTRAIVAVHIYGHPAAMRRLRAIADARGLALVEDAAEAHGAELDGARVGGLGRAGTFSFYANKIVTSGEGGMVTTNDAALERVLRRLRDHAFHPERHFWHEYLGFNYRMTNLQAAVGLAQTERLGEIVEHRRRLRALYDERLRAIPGLDLPGEDKGARSVFWMYAVRIGAAFGASRDGLRRQLAARGIETRTFFVPIHIQPVYFDRFRGRRFPVAESLCRHGLYLPTSEALEERDVDWICGEIADIHRRAAPAAAAAS